MKILLSAFSCGPGRGSEPGVGWNWVLQISKRHEVWLLASDEFKADVERELPANVTAVFIPSAARWLRLKALPLPGLDWLYYYWWQWKAYKEARRLQKTVKFDIAHHVTFVSWRVPSFLCLLGIPFIWGPVGGGGSVPVGLRDNLGPWGRIHESIRDLSQVISRFDPLVRMTMRKAKLILVATGDTLEQIPRQFQKKCRLEFCSAIASSELTAASRVEKQTGEFTVLFAGMLEPRKAVVLAIRAYAEFSGTHPNSRFLIIGQGPELPRLQALSQELGVADKVKFLGGMLRAQVLGLMATSDVFVFPSLRETCPLVLVEAMVTGLPVVCVNTGGPGEMVTSDCGVRIPIGPVDSVVSQMASALERLAESPGLRGQMGECGRHRAQEVFNWDKKGDAMADLYGAMATSSAIQETPLKTWI
jgi:glycosyltransferase involved in cell wall biosynthesis